MVYFLTKKDESYENVVCQEIENLGSYSHTNLLIISVETVNKVDFRWRAQNGYLIET